MTIPFVDLLAQHRSLQSQINQAIESVIAGSGYIRGPQIEEFEMAFAETIGLNHIRGVASGTDALHLALRALDIGPGDEVITQTNTWISTAFAISYVGATPVFVDVDPDTYQMDISALEQAITPNTKAVIPVHLYGHSAPMNQIIEICKPRNIKVIEDVAQAPLAELDNQIAGTFGDVACFSFYPSKNLGCLGDGGAVATNDSVLAEKIRQLSDYGQSSRHCHEVAGYNSRLDTLQAAVLLAKLPHLKEWTDARRDHAAHYNELLKNLPVKCPTEAQNVKAVYHLYVIQVDNRDACLDYLKGKGVMAQIHYPVPLHLQPCYRDLGYKKGDFPVAETACEHIISLPMYPELTNEQIVTVAESLGDFLNSN